MDGSIVASIGGGEMVLKQRSWSPVELKVDAASSILSIQGPHTNKSLVCSRAKSKASRHNHGGIEASVRRVCLFQIIVILGTLICENPVLVAGLARVDETRNYLRIGLAERPSDGVVLQGSPYTVALERPMVNSLQLSGDEDLEEILSVKLKLLRGKASAFRVFINLPNADENTAITCSEFSGSYLHEPRRVKNPDYEYQVTFFSIGISDIIKDLGLMEEPSILVTFVPCGADKGLPVVLQSVLIELD